MQRLATVRLATAAEARRQRQSAFASMLAADRRRPCRAGSGEAVFDNSARTKPSRSRCAAAEILAPIPNPGRCATALFPLHILQAPRGSSSLPHAQERHGQMARLNAEPLGDCPESIASSRIYYITTLQRRRHQHTVKWRVQQGDGLRTGIRDHYQKQGRQHLQPRRPKTTSSAIRSSTIFRARRPAHRNGRTPRSAKGKSFDGGNVMVPGSSPRTRSAILTSCTWKCG